MAVLLRRLPGAEGVARLVGGLPRIHETLGSIPRMNKPWTVMHNSDPNAQEVETGGSEVQSHPQLLVKLEANLGSMKLSQKACKRKGGCLERAS